MPMTLVIVEEREEAATRSLKVRWGSLTIRQAVVFSEVRRGWGRALWGVSWLVLIWAGEMVVSGGLG